MGWEMFLTMRLMYAHGHIAQDGSQCGHLNDIKKGKRCFPMNRLPQFSTFSAYQLLSFPLLLCFLMFIAHTERGTFFWANYLSIWQTLIEAHSQLMWLKMLKLLMLLKRPLIQVAYALLNPTKKCAVLSVRAYMAFIRFHTLPYAFIRFHCASIRF